MYHAPIPYRLPSHPSPYRLLSHNVKTHACSNPSFLDYIQLSFYKTNSFVFKPKVFWMLHFNDNLYKKLMCLFMGQRILVSHHRLRTPRHFRELSPLELCLTTANGSFTRRGVYLYLLLPDTSFLYHIIQPCDSIGIHST